MELRRRQLTGTILHPGRAFEPTQTQVEVRWDPLTGHGARLLRGKGLMPPNDYDIAGLAELTRATCPFCPDRLEEQTPRFEPAVCPEGRFRQGEAVCFPNLVSYARHSAVSVYSPARHLLELQEVTPRLMTDNLATQVAFARAAMVADPESRWVSVNANHMLPSGSSLFHPHLQGLVDPVPTTRQRMEAEVPAEQVRDYVDTERRLGERHVADTGTVTWLAGFAPVTPLEMRAFLFGAASPADLDAGRVEELATGIATVLRLYADLGFQSYNLAVYGAPPEAGGALGLRIGVRSNLRDPAYRSDASHLERLHWESAVDIWPEDAAEWARERFAR